MVTISMGFTLFLTTEGKIVNVLPAPVGGLRGFFKLF